KITPKAGEAGIIVGFIVGMMRLIANIFKDKLNTLDLTEIDWFWNTNWLVFEIYLLVFTVLVMVAVSFFTKKASEEKLKGITFFTQSPIQKAETRASWNYWDIVTSLGVVILCVLFYIYFW
ncbi:hypothetical protein EZS27_038738, partial [termite gut metagenome]